VGQLLGLGIGWEEIVVCLRGLWAASFCGCLLGFIGARCCWLGFKGTVNCCCIGGGSKYCIYGGLNIGINWEMFVG